MLGKTLGVLLLSTVVLLAMPVVAQVIPDSSLGSERTQVSPLQPIRGTLSHQIDGGAIRGNHLFHSFQQFNVQTGQGVYFSNPAAVTNIFTRITGGSISNIDGVVGVLGNANLFLLNPNGILFGPGARLDLGGSFLGTTANSIKFSDGFEFSAKTYGASPLLTVSLPIGLQMGQTPATITVQGSGHRMTGGVFSPLDRSQNPIGLEVNPGKTLALIGGNVDVTGGILKSNGGQITLGSIQSGILGVNLTTSTPWRWDTQQIQTWGDLRLQQQALVDGSGVGAASIQLLGRNISLKDQSTVLLQNMGAQPAGDITVRATETLTLSGISADGQISSRILSQTLGGGGGNIDVRARDIFQNAGAKVTTQTFSKAQGGNLILNVENRMRVEGYTPAGPTGTTWNSTVSFGEGRAGDIHLSSQNLSQSNGAQFISGTFGSGRAGDLDIRVADTIDLADSQPNIETSLASISFNSGRTGDVTVNTARLLLRQGGVLGAGTLSSGNAGNLTVNASQSVIVRGTVPGTEYRSRILANAEKLSLISQQAFGLPEIPTGNSGSLTITTPHLQVIDGGEIAVRNDGPGDAGDLTLRTNSILLNNQGRISASTVSGKGGDIILSSSNWLVLRNQSSLVASAGGTGNGGSMELTAPIIVGLENSDIIANAQKGRGGNINITTQGLFGLKYRDRLTPDNDITASSEFGINGNVQVNTIGINPANALNLLPIDVVDSSRQIADRCSSARSGSFISTGRGGMSRTPIQTRQTDRPWKDLRSMTDQNPGMLQAIVSENPVQPLVEASAIELNETGELTLVATQSSRPNLQSATCSPSMVKSDRPNH